MSATGAALGGMAILVAIIIFALLGMALIIAILIGAALVLLFFILMAIVIFTILSVILVIPYYLIKKSKVDRDGQSYTLEQLKE
ncbi:MAG TPA: hypothetical protein ENN25_03810 [Euryarchaeota archaeon]|nr:hypothetical protein [Euryarchaeota archaeon]